MPSSKGPLSVVIPARNEQDYLPRLLRSLVSDAANTPLVVEIVVVDDGSTDATSEIAQGVQDSRVRVVETGGVGVSRARNAGAIATTSPVIAFVDADVVLPSGSVSQAFAHMRANSLSVATTRFRDDGLAGIWRHGYGALNVFFEAFERTANPACSGFFMLCSRDAFESVGGFSPDLTYGEDHDLVRRAVALGHRFGICREAHVEVSARRFRGDTPALIAMRPYVVEELERIWRFTVVPACHRLRRKLICR